MENYEINRYTLAVISEEDKTKIYEVDNSYVINTSTKSIMENSCEYFGSSLSGRQVGTTKLTGVTHKVPIIIEETNKIIFFPTSSPRNKDCSWISLKHIKSYYNVDNCLCIEFKNGEKLFLDTSFNVFDNQVLRSCRLESILTDRIS